MCVCMCEYGWMDGCMLYIYTQYVCTHKNKYMHAYIVCVYTSNQNHHTHASSIDMYNNDVGQESTQKFMKQTGDLKAATLYFAS